MKVEVFKFSRAHHTVLVVLCEYQVCFHLKHQIFASDFLGNRTKGCRKRGAELNFSWRRSSSGTLFFLLAERCDDWGVDTMKQIQIYDGEPAKIKCPLFETFLKYNYSTAHSAGLTLIWYRIGQDRDLEEPINFRLPDNRISKEKDTLWFWPALLNDTGNYTCMLRQVVWYNFCNQRTFMEAGKQCCQHHIFLQGEEHLHKH